LIWVNAACLALCLKTSPLSVLALGLAGLGLVLRTRRA